MAYNKTVWENLPSTSSPINADNLNHIEEGIYQNSINIESVIPAGTINAFAGNNTPSGWLICDGSEISRITYATLFNVIGTTYGSGNGTTTFNVPDLQGKIIVGVDNNDTDFDTLGETGGEKTHTLTVNEMPSHRHTLSDVDMGQSNDNTLGGSYPRMTRNTTGTTSYSGGGQAHNNLQPYMVINYVIKY